MRRLDLISILLLILVVGAAWWQLRPRDSDAGGVTLSEPILKVFDPWQGPADRALSSSAASSPASSEVANDSSSNQDGTVKGVSTEPLNIKPLSLLPIEHYTGSPAFDNLEQMLAANQVTINPEDMVEAFPPPNLGIGSVITVYRATPVEVTDWGKTKIYRTWQITVKGFVEEAGLEVGENDRLTVPVDSRLSLENGVAKITIIRVAVTEIKENQPIDFPQVSKEDPTLPLGQTKLDKGEKGIKTTVYQVTRENGVEVKRVKLSESVTKQPKTETKIIGTKVVIGKVVSGRASWYKYTSTKVASDQYKRGTKLRITNLNTGKVITVTNDGCICADTGYVVDLHPDYFTALGGKITDGVMPNVKVEEILN